MASTDAVLEIEVWEPKPSLFLFLLFLCFSSIFLFPPFARANRSSLLDAGRASASFLRFRRGFLLLFSFASFVNGLESVFGEYEYQHYGVGRNQMVFYLSSGIAAALFLGTLLGMLSDVIGPRKFCMLFCIIHLLVGVLKSVTKHPSLWFTSILLSLASSMLSFCYESWMVVEHEKQGYRHDLLTDTFWLITFFGSASLIGSQAVANFLAKDIGKGIVNPSAPSAFVALLSTIYIRKEWNGKLYSSSIPAYLELFCAHVLGDRRIWLLAIAQTCLHFSLSIFWILWAPTIVADGRDVKLPLLYPCFLGSRMLGSTAIPWFLNGASPFRNNDYLITAFVIGGLCLSIVAYDYQEIAILVALFSVFNACIGLILPSLAQLRTLYVPNQLRGGMISLSLAPSNAAIFFLIGGGYYRNFDNSTIMAFSVLALFSGAGCIYALKRWRKETLHNWHKV